MLNRYKNTKNNNIIVASQEFIDTLSDSANYELVIEQETVISLEELKEQKLNQVQEKSNSDYQAFISKYPDVEQKSFEKKAEEAYKVSADRTLALSETRYLTDLTGGLDNSTIELRNALADAVSAKTIAMAQLETWGVLKRDEIANCTTIDELNLITI